jgi:hypothetical protein
MLYGDDILKNFQAITDSPNRNPAVRACSMAGLRAQEEVRKANPRQRDTFDATQAAVIAYRDAMPSLDGYENVRDYIACVAHGMILGAIDIIEGPKLLYAAQIALGVLPREPKRPVGRPPKDEKINTPPPSPAVTT